MCFQDEDCLWCKMESSASDGGKGDGAGLQLAMILAVVLDDAC